jgi:hypothetical protein
MQPVSAAKVKYGIWGLIIRHLSRDGKSSEQFILEEPGVSLSLRQQTVNWDLKGADYWSSYRNDCRLCVGWLENHGRCPNHDHRGTLGESGSDLRGPIYEAAEP